MDSAESLSPDVIADYFLAHIECECVNCEKTKMHWRAGAAADGKTLREWIKQKFGSGDDVWRRIRPAG